MQTQQLAAEFSRILRTWLTPEEMSEAVARNARETSPDVCHTHRFCDANMAMEEAFTNLGLVLWTPEGHMLGASQDLWNEAWALAQAAAFH